MENSRITSAAFAASPWTNAANNRPYPTLKYNQFSLAAGGPVYIPKIYNGKNKTFWFAAFEPNYRRDKLDQYGLLPTDGMRQGDFSGLVNTPSGWLPQSVVDQFKSVAPAAGALRRFPSPDRPRDARSHRLPRR